VSIPPTESWTLLQGGLVFLMCAAIIAVAGTRITRVVDQLADRTGIGEAAAGAVLLGASTSLGGSVLSVTVAWNGHAELAVSNALGGIAVQTFFLAVADMVYRRANLEHAAASVPNMMQNGLLICLLALTLLAPYLPDVTIGGVYPVTPVLLAVYFYGLYLVRAASESPMWLPSITGETREDKPDDVTAMPPMSRLWGRSTFSELCCYLVVSRMQTSCICQLNLFNTQEANVSLASVSQLLTYVQLCLRCSIVMDNSSLT